MNVHVQVSYYYDTGEANDVESGLGYNQHAMAGWLPKHAPPPYVLPRRIWSFCVKVCRYKIIEGNPKIGERWNHAP